MSKSKIDNETSNIGKRQRIVTFKTFYWKFEDTEEGALQIHVAGRTADNKSVHCIVENFTPFVYLELPKKIRWNKAKCIAVFEYFKKVMKSDGPIEMWLMKKYRLKYKDPINTIRMTFPTQKAAAALGNRCRNCKNGLVIDGVGVFRPGDLVVHETNVDPILKLTATKNLKLASWVTVKETIRAEDVGTSIDERKYSTADIDLYANWTDIEGWIPDKVIIVRPTYVSFDIECYSENHNSKLPNAELPGNFIFSIANTCGSLGGEIAKKVLFTLFNPNDIEGVEVIRCKDERELLLKWREFIDEHNPDILISYNGMKFDWGYMIARAEYNRIYLKFAQHTRIIGRRSELMESNWSSSAYGEQKFRYLDPMGRTNVDILIEIERNYKLPQYGLNATSEYFLNEHKDDVLPRELFMLVQLTMVMTPLVENLPDGVIKKNHRIRLKEEIQRILPLRRCRADGPIRPYRKTLMSFKTGKQIKFAIREALTITGTYNVQDTILPVRLAEKLNLWTTMEEISNCQHVPMSYLHTRGQQIKVLAQYFRKTLGENVVVTYKDKLKDGERVKYEGAVVIEAVPGDYHNVICTDFESLYPSMMIAYNVCHTTILKPDDPTPDDQCHVIKISSHIGCIHDPKKRKKKEADILCRDVIHRFKKVIFHADGTREGEGLLPNLVRNLLLERKVKKKELAKLSAKLAMAEGLAEAEDIAFYKKVGWEIIEKGSLTKEELDILKVSINVLNAQQLALKVSANSAYGTLGAQNGPIPLVEGAETVTAMGRDKIMDAIKYILQTYPEAKLVYGDTDSSMITFEGKTTEESFALGDKVSKDTTHYLKMKMLNLDMEYSMHCHEDGQTYRLDKYPRDKMESLRDEDKIFIYQYDSNPVNLQFENLYKRYLLLSKKRYVAHAVNRKGKIVGKIKKGVVLARRDNCVYLRDSYKLLTEAILDLKSETEIRHILYDQIHKLFTRQIPAANLIIYMAVKTVMNYAKKEKNTEIFIDEDGNHITDPYGPLDPRLQYPNLPQVLLALKMLRRGDEVPPNTRLEYIYLQTENATHQGEKAEDYTFYRENKEILDLKPDYLHYIEKQLSRPVTELFQVKYPPKMIPYEKLEDHLNRLIDELNDLLRHRVKDVKNFEKKVSSFYDSEVIGWSCYGTARERSLKIPVGCKKCHDLALTDRKKRCAIHKVNLQAKTYTYKKLAAKIEYILNSMAIKKKNPKAPNEISALKYPELHQVALRWKSREIMNRLYVQYGLRKRPAKRATQTGEKLRIKTKDEFNTVFLTKKIKKYPKGTLVTLKDIQEHTYENSVKKKKYYTYTLETKEGEILENVPRDSITTWYYQDSSMMKDVLLARGYYMCVVDELNEIFKPINFVGLKREVKTFSIEDVDEGGD